MYMKLCEVDLNSLTGRKERSIKFSLLFPFLLGQGLCLVFLFVFLFEFHWRIQSMNDGGAQTKSSWGSTLLLAQCMWE